MTIVMVAAALALVRLHATGGYCSPRHAMVLALPLIAAAAAGLTRILTSLAIPGRLARAGRGPIPGRPRRLGGGPRRARGGRLPRNSGADQRGLRAATATPATGWRSRSTSPRRTRRRRHRLVALLRPAPRLHVRQPGRGPARPDLRWVVVREAHLHGPWDYCQQIRSLVAGLAARGVASPRIPGAGRPWSMSSTGRRHRPRPRRSCPSRSGADDPTVGGERAVERSVVLSVRRR